MNPLQDRSDDEIRADLASIDFFLGVLRHDNPDPVGRLLDDVGPLLARAVAAEAENVRLFRELSNQEKFNIESRRSLCAQSDMYKAERDVAVAQVEAVRRVPHPNPEWSEHYHMGYGKALVRVYGALGEPFSVPVYPTPTGEETQR